MKNRYFYVKSKSRKLWVIREHLPKGKSRFDSEHFTEEAAAKRTAFLNGENMMEYAYL